VLKDRVPYDETILARHDADFTRRLEARVRRQAHSLGFALVPNTALDGGVS